jgi:hypothetical protein
MKNKLKYFKRGLGVVGVMLILFSCDADVEVDRSFEEILAAQPEILEFSPQSASVLEEVVIEGVNLNFVTKAFIGNVETEITERVNSDQMRIRVVPEASNGPIRLVTQAGKEVISDAELNVNFPEPDITSEVPSESVVNSNITLEGENMDVITKVTFGDSEGIIEFKGPRSIVVKTPNNSSSSIDLNIWYYTSQGETSETLVEDYAIVIPKPEVFSWPGMMSRYQDISVLGENMNLIESVMIGGISTPILSATATTITFAAPDQLSTGFHDVTFIYGEAEEITEEDVPYINGELEVFYDWDNYTEEAVDLDLSKDPLATQQLNGDVSQPPFPQGENYYHLEMGTPTGSTIARLKVHETTENPTWVNILDDGNYNNNPVLHMWVNTQGTDPILKIYMGGTGSDNRRELRGGNLNNGDDWKLIAVRLKDFIPSIDAVGSVMEFRINTGSGAEEFPVILNLDWIIVTDQVLTEFGAVDVTDEFKPAG